jgi:hypothetical protein
MPDGQLPRIELALRAVKPARIAGLSAYRENWHRLLPG